MLALVFAVCATVLLFAVLEVIAGQAVTRMVPEALSVLRALVALSLSLAGERLRQRAYYQAAAKAVAAGGRLLAAPRAPLPTTPTSARCGPMTAPAAP